MAANATTAFGVVAFAVAMVGVYSVTVFLVAGHTREIGIHLALGAGRRDIRREFIRPSFVFVAGGALAGLAGAFTASRWFADQLFGVPPADLPTYLAVSAVVAVTALIAAWFPAQRAARIDPPLTLRVE